MSSIEAFRTLIEDQISGGVEGVVPVGTTGESPTLTHEEHTEVIQTAIEAARGRCRVIAGTGSNSTAEAISLTREAEKLGADAALLVAPYYNKPSQEGLYRHYHAIASAVEIPLCFTAFEEVRIEIGGKPSRSSRGMPNIVGIKGRGARSVNQLRRQYRRFEILSGDGSLTLPFFPPEESA